MQDTPKPPPPFCSASARGLLFPIADAPSAALALAPGDFFLLLLLLAAAPLGRKETAARPGEG